jgi:predicted transcriptional regulator
MESKPSAETSSTTPPKFKTRGRELLAAWLARDGAPSITQAAKVLGVSRAALIAFRDGVYRPKHDVRDRIERYTAKDVPAKAWLTKAERDDLKAITPFVPANDTHPKAS